MPRKKTEAMPEEPQEQTEIEPGEGVDIHLARLESGEWFGRIGEPDDDAAIVATAAWPWEALRGLAKQVKQSNGALAAYRIVGEQEMGRCEHASSDSGACVLLGCPIEEVEAVVQSLKRVREQLGSDFAVASGGEIVRLCGTLKEPVLRGKGEDEDLLTATFEVTGEDLTPEFRYLKPSAKKQVVAIVYHAYAAPRSQSARPDQLGMPFDQGTDEGPVVETCGELVRFVHVEDAEGLTPASLDGEDCQVDLPSVLYLGDKGDELFAVTEAMETDPVSWEAYRMVPCEDFAEAYHEDASEGLDQLHVGLRPHGDSYVLVGPPVRILVQPEDEGAAEPEGESGDEPIEGQAD